MSTQLALGTATTSSVVAWTPSLSFSTPGNLSFSGVTADGVYQKVGNLVFFDFRLIATPTFTTASGGCVISLPLPIAAVAGSGLQGVLNSYTAQLIGVTLPAGTFQVFLDLGVPGTSSTSLVYQNGTTPAPLQASNFTSGTLFSLRGGGRYYTP